jgi:hypothetical protein
MNQGPGWVLMIKKSGEKSGATVPVRAHTGKNLTI